MSEQQNAFIPNSFQTPNIYIDKFMHLLTPEENTVLMYAVRRIFGFGKREDYISRSQFERGTLSQDGEQLDHGTGLSHTAIKAALDALKSFGLVIEVKKFDPMTNTPSCYSLQLNASRVNLKAMENRLAAKKDAAKQRTQKARNALQNDTPVSGTEQGLPRQSDRPAPVSGTERPPSVGQTLIETQLETQKETQYSPRKRGGLSFDENLIEEIYQAYPLKVHKTEAIAAIRKAAENLAKGKTKVRPDGYEGVWPMPDPVGFLLERVKAFAPTTEGKEKKYIPHCATWMNRERFNDQYQAEGPSGFQMAGQSHVSAEDKAAMARRFAERRMSTSAFPAGVSGGYRH